MGQSRSTVMSEQWSPKPKPFLLIFTKISKNASPKISKFPAKSNTLCPDGFRLTDRSVQEHKMA